LLKGFLGHFCDIDQFGGNRVRDEAYRTSFNVAVTMSAIAAHDCIATWQASASRSARLAFGSLC